jgi:hypothetical protein
MSPNPRKVAGGVTAAVLGSGVTAALLLGPNPTNAAPPTTSEVAGTDATDETDDAATDSQSTERGDRLRELLQPLVDSGSLTEGEADAIVAELAAGLPSFTGPQIQVGPDIQVGPGGPVFPGHEVRGGGRGQFRIISAEVIAEAIGIDVETLRGELRNGATVAEVAEANGVDPQAVVDALVADYTERVTAWIEGEQPASEEETASDGVTDTTTETTTT